VGAPLTFQVGNHFFGDGAKTVLLPGLLDLPIDLAPDRWIDAARKQFLGGVSRTASVGERNDRVGTQSERLLLAGESVG
jgi:hypothetical protein